MQLKAGRHYSFMVAGRGHLDPDLLPSLFAGLFLEQQTSLFNPNVKVTVREGLPFDTLRLKP